MLGELPEVLPGDDAAGQPGEEELDRLRLGRVGRGLAAVRFHQRPGDVETGLGEGGEGVLDVALHDRFHIAVGDDGAAPLVLPPDRRDLVREGDRHAWEAPFQELAQPQLVGRVDVGEEEADGDGGVALGVVRDALCDAAGEILQRLIGEGDERPAVEIEPLRDPEAVASLDERPRLGPLQREVMFAVHALDVRDVLETRRW